MADTTKATATDAKDAGDNTPVTEKAANDQATARNKEARKGGPRADGRHTSLDTFANPHERALANVQTATDAHGIERIIAAHEGNWKPAPLEASDEEKKAAERRNKMFDKASKTRLEQAKGDIKDSDRAINDPSQGGSQSGTPTEAELKEKQNR